MDDLVRWLGERLDEDAARAEAARDAEFCKDGRWLAKGPFEEGLGSVHSEASEAILGEEESVPFALADHIARHAPARVLREIDAKRRIIEQHTVSETSDFEGKTATITYCPICRNDGECPTLRLLAAVYADRPGYRKEWRP